MRILLDREAKALAHELKEKIKAGAALDKDAEFLRKKCVFLLHSLACVRVGAWLTCKTISHRGAPSKH